MIPKYRIWDKKLKKMCYSVDDVIKLEDESSLYSRDEWYPFFEVALPFYLQHFLKEQKDRMVLMQYTGIQDKNGKEIYEGDIIEFEDTFENEHKHNNQAVVRKSRLEFFLSEFKFIDGGTEKCLMSNDCALIGVLDSCTVIGNIYENREIFNED